MSGPLQVTIYKHGDHAAVPVHEAGGQFMLGMGGQAWVDHFVDHGMTRQPGGDFSGGLIMLTHAEGQGFDAAQGQIAVERPGNTADGILQKGQSFP